jgi:flagellar hook-associated protein 1
LGTAPAAGDTYLLQPTRYLGRNMTALISDPLRLALASPLKSSAALTNISDATITQPTTLDPANASLLTATQLVFNNPPSTYQVNGAGPLIPFTSGASIDLNGWRILINGTPAAGDVFRIEANTNGRGDNQNGRALAALRTDEILIGGTASFQDAYGQLIGRVGSRAQQAQISQDALKVQLDNAQASRDAVSAVNLDEEAANLIRFQQAFQAAAQLIQVTREAFASLLQAVQ